MGRIPDELSPADYPIDSKLYLCGTMDPDPFHVRGHVDGHLVVKHWRRGKARWELSVITPIEVGVGLYTRKPLPPAAEATD